MYVLVTDAHIYSRAHVRMHVYIVCIVCIVFVACIACIARIVSLPRNVCNDYLIFICLFVYFFVCIHALYGLYLLSVFDVM